MTNTILSQKQAELLENLIAKYGVIVNFEQIYKELKHKISRQEVRNLVSKLFKNGWLVRIKKGVYYITTLESRGTASGLSAYIIAQILVKDSYISTEAALQYHGMFDQYLKTITSVSQKQYKTKNIQKIIYKFIKTNKKHFYGWKEVSIQSKSVKIATAEKAILDLLSFDKTIYAIDLVLEKLKEYKHNFSFNRFSRFIERQSISVQRILGFLFDKADIDSSYIQHQIKNKAGCSYMSQDSKIFNAKWRLYYHQHFNQYL